MIEYRLRVEIPESTDRGSGVALLWEALSRYTRSSDAAFALCMCPDRPDAILLGAARPIEWAQLRDGITRTAGGADAPLMVEQGQFPTQLPLGFEELAAIRDQFRRAMFDDLACLMTNYPTDGLARLVPVAETFLLLERLCWADDQKLWPLSLNGHLWAFARRGGSAVPKVRQAAQKLIPLLAAAAHSDAILAPDKALPEKFATRLGILQSAYDSVGEFVAGIAADDRRRLSEDAGNLLANILSATHTVEAAHDLASQPNHMTYRIFMSLIYDLAPLIALPTTRKLIVIQAVTEHLRHDHPAVIAAAVADGNRLGSQRS